MLTLVLSEWVRVHFFYYVQLLMCQIYPLQTKRTLSENSCSFWFNCLFFIWGVIKKPIRLFYPYLPGRLELVDYRELKCVSWILWIFSDFTGVCTEFLRPWNVKSTGHITVCCTFFWYPECWTCFQIIHWNAIFAYTLKGQETMWDMWLLFTLILTPSHVMANTQIYSLFHTFVDRCSCCCCGLTCVRGQVSARSRTVDSGCVILKRGWLLVVLHDIF